MKILKEAAWEQHIPSFAFVNVNLSGEYHTKLTLIVKHRFSFRRLTMPEPPVVKAAYKRSNILKIFILNNLN
jgi:hypothetical protein